MEQGILCEKKNPQYILYYQIINLINKTKKRINKMRKMRKTLKKIGWNLILERYILLN